MIYSNTLERWYLFSTSWSEATGISGSCNNATHASIAYQGHHKTIHNIVTL